jgi:hypothetical protein
MKYVPADSEVVVQSENSAALDRLHSELKDKVRVEAIAGDTKSRLVKFATPGNIKSRVKSLQAQLGKDLQVFPLLLDPSGQRLVPTGQVRVRFSKRVGKKDLEKFAAEKALKLVERDEYAPEQATFQPAHSGEYLLDVIDRATAGTDVRLAWPETKAKFTKTS